MSIDETLAERGDRYGDFRDHARVAQGLKTVLFNEQRYWNLPDMHSQALEVICDKIARIITGDCNYPDNWHDIQGYARLVEERLP